jgi:uncharacterized protein YndB with AHSA1/START domain
MIAEVLALLMISGTANAAVLDAAPDSFTLRYTIEAPATAPDKAYVAWGEVGRWWSSSHTYSGTAQAITVDLKAGGCWCESWLGGSIEHARVLLAMPGRTLRFAAPFGPLQALPVQSILSVTFAPGPAGGSITTVTMRVAGPSASKLDVLGPVIDRVMAEQMTRLAGHLGGQVIN